MKKFPMFAATILAAVLLTAPALAQSTYTIRIPFTFHVAAKDMPAGEYRVEMIKPGALQVRCLDTPASALFTTTSLLRDRSDTLSAHLVFHQYGKQYFLAQVWFEDANAGYRLSVSMTERQIAQGTPGSSTVLRAGK